MLLKFDYKMKLHYTEPVSRCYFTIKCLPKDTLRQRLINHELNILPPVRYNDGADSYNNRLIYGHLSEPHDYFTFEIAGTVLTNASPYEEKAVESRIGMYRYSSGKCIPGEAVKAYYESIRQLFSDKSDYEKGICLMHRLHQDFSYVKNSTDAATTAEAAMLLGHGVCQDYAHICICLLRLAGIPARYACGFMLGEGASHAWVEFMADGFWHAYDPTNDCMVREDYIKLGDGRDAAECAINRATMFGGGTQTQYIAVKVQALSESAEQ